MSIKIEIIKAPATKAKITKEPKKSKAHFRLKEKIRLAYKTIVNFAAYKFNADVSNLSDLDSYIEFLNSVKFNYEKAIEKNNEIFNKEFDEANLDSEKEQIFKRFNDENIDLTDKVSEIDYKIENAKAEEESRKVLEEMDVEDLDDEKLDEEFTPISIEASEEEFTPEPIELSEEFAPIEEPVSDTVPVDVELEPDELEQKIINEVMSEIDIDTPIETDFRTDDNVEDNEIEENKVESEPVVESTVEPVVEPQVEEKVSPLEQFVKDYENSLNEIENNYKESFARDISELVARIKNEAEKNINMQLEEMQNAAKIAIDAVKQTNQNILAEKAAVEEDRDQFKSHYEQTVEIVKQKDQTIQSKDDEIAALKAEIEKKNNELTAANDREVSLNATIDKKNKLISQNNDDIRRYKISMATMAQALYTGAEKGQENVDLTQTIQLGGMVESEEEGKTL